MREVDNKVRRAAPAAWHGARARLTCAPRALAARAPQVVRVKEVFDVSSAAQRDMVDGFQPVLSKNAFALGGVGGSSLLGKRQNKTPAKSSDVVTLAAAAKPASGATGQVAS